ncbi:MAG: hypothetical protein LQ351_005712 [Letrouitia transgressa]|nr:MAG: hypothetical protein LQ351_005712 [Letrouitia transgressa]
MSTALQSTYSDSVQIAIIGGTGLSTLPTPPFTPVAILPAPPTPWGLPSSPISILRYAPLSSNSKATTIAFLARHGIHHQLAPHEVPNQANIAALRKLGVRCIIAFSAVGSLREEVRPRDFLIADQLIDWTRGSRPPTFFSDGLVGHVSLAEPFDPSLATLVTRALTNVRPPLSSSPSSSSSLTPPMTVHPRGTVITISGPHFSTRAESLFFRSPLLSCDVVNMSAAPEAKLAREAEIGYAIVCMSTDYDSWHATNEGVSVEMVIGHMETNSVNARRAVESIVQELAKEENEDIVVGKQWEGMVKGAAGITKVEGRGKEAMSRMEWLFPGYFESG